MSVHCVHLVPVHRGDYPEAEAKALEVVRWLAEQDMVEREPSDCTLDAKPGYRFLPAIETLFSSEGWYRPELGVHGVSIAFEERRVFHPMDSADLNMTCRACGHVHDMDEATSFIPGWFDGSDEFPKCHVCGHAEHIAEWPCDPEWGFSNLGVTFWNSPADFTPDFIATLKGLYGTELRMVFAHI